MSSENEELRYVVRIDFSKIEMDIKAIQSMFDKNPVRLKLALDDANLRQISQKIQAATGGMVMGGGSGSGIAVSGAAMSIAGSLFRGANSAPMTSSSVSIPQGTPTNFISGIGNGNIGGYTMQGMRCPQCGAVVAPGSVNCTRCGANLQSAWQRFTTAHPVAGTALIVGGQAAVGGAQLGWGATKLAARGARGFVRAVNSLLFPEPEEKTVSDLYDLHSVTSAHMEARLMGIHSTISDMGQSTAGTSYSGPSASDIGQANAASLSPLFKKYRPARRKPKPRGGSGGGGSSYGEGYKYTYAELAALPSEQDIHSQTIIGQLQKEDAFLDEMEAEDNRPLSDTEREHFNQLKSKAIKRADSGILGRGLSGPGPEDPYAPPERRFPKKAYGRRRGGFISFGGSSSINPNGGVGNSTYGPSGPSMGYRAAGAMGAALGRSARNTDWGRVGAYGAAAGIAAAHAYASGGVRTSGNVEGDFQSDIDAYTSTANSGSLGIMPIVSDSIPQLFGFEGYQAGTARIAGEARVANKYVNSRYAAQTQNKMMKGAILGTSESFADQQSAVYANRDGQLSGVSDKYRQLRDDIGMEKISDEEKRSKRNALTKDQNIETQNINKLADAQVGRMNRDNLFAASQTAIGNQGSGMSNYAGILALQGNGIGSTLTGLQAQRAGLQQQFNASTRGLDKSNPLYQQALMQQQLGNGAIAIQQQQAIKDYGLHLGDMEASNKSAYQSLNHDFLGSQMTMIDNAQSRALSTMSSGEYNRAQQGYRIARREAVVGEENRSLIAGLDTSRIETSGRAGLIAASGQELGGSLESIKGNREADIKGVRAMNLTDAEKDARIKAIGLQSQGDLEGIKRTARQRMYGGTASSFGNFINFAQDSTRDRDPQENMSDVIDHADKIGAGLTQTQAQTKNAVAITTAGNQAVGAQNAKDATVNGIKDNNDMNAGSDKDYQIIALLQKIADRLPNALAAQ